MARFVVRSNQRTSVVLAFAGIAALLFLVPIAWMKGWGGGTSVATVTSAAGSSTRSGLLQNVRVEELETMLAAERNRTHEVQLQSEEELRGKDEQLAEKDRLLQEKDVQLAEREKLLREKEEQLAEKEKNQGAAWQPAGGGEQPPHGDELAKERDELRQRVEDLLREKEELQAEKDRLEQETHAQPGGGGEQPADRAELEQRVQEVIRERDHVGEERNVLLEEAKQGLYSSSLVFRDYLKAHSKELENAWRERVAGQRQRGVVIAAGGDHSTPLTNAFVGLYVLRHHLKCTLPAAIMYWDAEGSSDAISEGHMAIFKEHITDVEFIDASKLPIPEYHRTYMPSFVGWKVKVLALYSAPFQEVLSLDSDCMALLEPSSLFETEQYQQHGNLFFPSFYLGDQFGFRVEELFTMFKLENPWADKAKATFRQTDSGVFMFNRAKHWEVLEWILFVNSHNEVVYRTTYGDMNTFHVSFHLAGKPDSFQQEGHGGGAAVFDELKWKSLLHFHPNGSIMFLHLTPLGKYNLGDRSPRNVTHLTGVTSPAWGAHIFANWNLQEDEVQRVNHNTCNYSLYDWPGAQHACTPDYDDTARERTGKLPFFQIPPDSYFRKVEEAADAGIAELRRATGHG